VAQYALRRLLNAIPILIGITIISFAIIHLAPGNPLSAFLDDPKITAADKQNMIIAAGLDKPIITQYWIWVSGIMKGDFGTSFHKSEPVLKLIREYMPNTLLLTITSFLLSLLIAVPLGILCALRANSKLDQIITGLSNVGLAIPGFWLALILMMVFGVKLGWLPIGGLSTINSPFSIVDRIQHLIMPVVTIAIAEAAVWTRYVRSSMLEVINQDYMRTAKAKGLLPGRILTLHGLRNALIPLATLFGLSIPGFFAGSVVLEAIFSIPGVGRLLIEATFQRDYPIITSLVTLGAIMTVLGNIVADLLIGILDPRVSLSKKGVKV
jgi:peptide/nickel transport system permease protein